MLIRSVVALVAVAPFVLLVVAMLTGRARVTACCGDNGDQGAEAKRSSRRDTTG